MLARRIPRDCGKAVVTVTSVTETADLLRGQHCNTRAPMVERERVEGCAGAIHGDHRLKSAQLPQSGRRMMSAEPAAGSFRVALEAQSEESRGGPRQHRGPSRHGKLESFGFDFVASTLQVSNWHTETFFWSHVTSKIVARVTYDGMSVQDNFSKGFSLRYYFETMVGAFQKIVKRR